MKSIQSRLTLGLIGVLVIVGLVLAQASLWLFELGLQRYLESGLRNESEGLLVALVQGPQGLQGQQGLQGPQGLQLDEQLLSSAYKQPYSGHYFRIDFAQGNWRSRSLWDLDLPKPSQPDLHPHVESGPGGQSLLVLRADYHRFGQPLSITVARDYTPIKTSFERIQHVGLGLGLIALIIILLLQRLTVRHALRPLETARNQIAQLQQGQRSLLDEQVPLELEPLVKQINHLLAHTEDNLKRSRNALGNLGHALKTPLAVLISIADSEQLGASPELRNTVREQLQQIQQRLKRELTRARLAGDALPGEQFDCDSELSGLFATLGMIHGDHPELSQDVAPGLRLPWDREDVLELLGNLLDNACKWADRAVCLTIRQQSQGHYCLLVDDDGPGIPKHRRNEVLSRGIRLDEQISGHGLGLGIVHDIVEAWGGDLQLLSSSLGGLQVRIDLPAPMVNE